MARPLYSPFKGEIDSETQAYRFDICETVHHAYYPDQPISQNSTPTLVLTYCDGTIRDNKRVKRTVGIPEWGGDLITYRFSFPNPNTTRNRNSISKLHLRDHIRTYTQRYLAAESVEEAAEDTNNSSESDWGEEDGCADGVRLVQLLIACAEAVACRDKSHASILLSELKANALVFGSSLQRVASCFVQGLTERLHLIQPIGPVGPVPPTMNIMDAASEEMEDAFRLVYELCPHIQFGHFVANSAVLEAFEGESFVHVVDLGMSLGLRHGHQWRGLIQSLANCAGGDRERDRRLRITGVGLCDRLQTIGDELSVYANNLGVNLEFALVKKNLENLRAEDIEVREERCLW
ncbi:DELLA protein DWARF8 [Spatholobus suberectus]|nr:DELLA protein DWARF8 [Spatholobus suberectus]